MDLEAEFEKYIDGIYADLEKRVLSKEITRNEADAMISLISQRLEQNGDNNFQAESDLSGWNSSTVCW
jgi:hypothetical protein